jgi:hypothetical protein
MKLKPGERESVIRLYRVNIFIYKFQSHFRIFSCSAHGPGEILGLSLLKMPTSNFEFRGWYFKIIRISLFEFQNTPYR